MTILYHYAQAKGMDVSAGAEIAVIFMRVFQRGSIT